MTEFIKARGRRAYSQFVADRDFLINHIKVRLEECKTKLQKMHIPFRNFESNRPNIDIRHGTNLTPDGDYKRDWLAGLNRGIGHLPGWGSPHHLESVVGFHPASDSPILAKGIALKQKADDVSGHLHRKFRRSLPQMSPVRCIGFTRNKMAQMFNDLGFTKGAEIGVREGIFSEVLCKAIPNLDLLCIDIWEPYPGHRIKKTAEQHYTEAVERLGKYNAKLIKQRSVDASKDISDGSLDFVYIDAAHRFDNVMEDIINWAPKVRPGGIVSGHDYYRGRNNGVLPAVDAYTYAHQITEWFITDEKESTFFWVKV